MANEITSIEELESKLRDCYGTLSSAEMDHKKVLVNSLKAQLEVISVAKEPTLCKSALDLMLQALSDAADDMPEGKELRNIQKRTALMVNNMIFFFDAYLKYLEAYVDDLEDKMEIKRLDKKAEVINEMLAGREEMISDGQRLLEKAFNTLADTTNEMFNEVAKIGTASTQGNAIPTTAVASVIGFSAPQVVVGKFLFDNFIKTGPQVYNYFAKKNLMREKQELKKELLEAERLLDEKRLREQRLQLKKLENGYYNFLVSVADKLKRYKYLFGKSVVLAEMINNKKEDLANFLNPKENKKAHWDWGIWSTPWMIIGIGMFCILVILAVSFGMVKWTNLPTLAVDKWLLLKFIGYIAIVCVAGYIYASLTYSTFFFKGNNFGEKFGGFVSVIAALTAPFLIAFGIVKLADLTAESTWTYMIYAGISLIVWLTIVRFILSFVPFIVSYIAKLSSLSSHKKRQKELEKHLTEIADLFCP